MPLIEQVMNFGFTGNILRLGLRQIGGKQLVLAIQISDVDLVLGDLVLLTLLLVVNLTRIGAGLTQILLELFLMLVG